MSKAKPGEFNEVARGEAKYDRVLIAQWFDRAGTIYVFFKVLIEEVN